MFTSQREGVAALPLFASDRFDLYVMSQEFAWPDTYSFTGDEADYIGVHWYVFRGTNNSIVYLGGNADTGGWIVAPGGFFTWYEPDGTRHDEGIASYNTGGNGYAPWFYPTSIHNSGSTVVAQIDWEDPSVYRFLEYFLLGLSTGFGAHVILVFVVLLPMRFFIDFLKSITG